MGKKIVWKIGNMNSINEILGVDDCRKFASFRVTSLSRWMSEAYCWTVTFHHSWFLVSCLFSSNRENRSNRGYVEVSKDISQVDGVLIQVRNEWRSLSMGCNVEESRLTNRFIDLSNPLKRKRSARMYILVKAFYQKFDFFSMKKDEVSGWSGWAKLIVDRCRGEFEHSSKHLPFSRDISIEIVIPSRFHLFVLVRRILIREGKVGQKRWKRNSFTN